MYREQSLKLNIKRSFLHIINNLAAFCLAFCCLTPTFAGKTMISVGIMGLWGVTAILSPYIYNLLNSKKIYMYLGLFCWMIITVGMILIRPETNSGGLYTGLLTSVVCIETLRNNLIKKDVKIVKWLAFASVLLYIFVLGRALLLGGTDSNVYRLNKASGILNETIGNFGIYYLVVFTLPLALFFVFKKKSQFKIFAIILAILSLLLLFFAQYTIAFIVEIVLLLIWFVVAKAKGNKGILAIGFTIIGIFALALILFSDELIVRPLTAIANSVSETSPMHQRLVDIVKTLKGDVSEENLAIDRLSRYKDSLINFIKHPIFGENIYNLLGFSLDNSITEAGHNSVIELINQYGLLFGIPYYLLMISLFKQVLICWKKIDYSFYSLLISIICAYFLLGLLNPIFNLFAMTWFLFNVILIAPLVFGRKKDFYNFSEVLLAVGNL